MEKQGRPWWHYVLGCGCISIIMAGIAGAVILFMGYRMVSSSLFFDHAKVNALAAEIFPGAKPPEGEDGLFGMDAFGIRMAVIASPNDNKGVAKGHLQFILMEMKDKVVSKEEAAKTISEKASSGSSGEPSSGNGTSTNKKEVILKSESATVTVGSKSFPAEKQLVQESSQGKVSRYLVPFRKGKGTAFIMVQGSPDDFNEAGMKQFLGAIDASGLEPLASASSTK